MKTFKWKRYGFGILAIVALWVGLVTIGVAQQAPAGRGAGAGRGGGAGAPAAAPKKDLDDPYNIDPKKGPSDLGITDPALIGAIDIHAHLEPTVARNTSEGGLAIDFVQMAKMVKRVGMRGYVQKSHSDITSAVNAYIVRTHIDPDLEVFGRMSMNLASGCVNFATVAHFANLKGGWGRVVEMPTWDAEYRNVGDRAPKTEERGWMLMMPPGSTPKYCSVAKNGELLPEVKALIDWLPGIRTTDSNGRLALATGHVSGTEALLLAREGRKVGLQVTSPHALDSGMTDAELSEYARLGGYVEVRNSAGAPSKAKATADTVRKIGLDHIIVSSDCGFMNYPLHTDCMGLIARALRSQGFTEKELDVVFKENPAKFLNIPLKHTVPSTTMTSTVQ